MFQKNDQYTVAVYSICLFLVSFKEQHFPRAPDQCVLSVTAWQKGWIHDWVRGYTAVCNNSRTKTTIFIQQRLQLKSWKKIVLVNFIYVDEIKLLCLNSNCWNLKGFHFYYQVLWVMSIRLRIWNVNPYNTLVFFQKEQWKKGSMRSLHRIRERLAWMWLHDFGM